MTDYGQMWKDHKDYLREKRDREGWVSNRYKTDEEREKSVEESSKLNFDMDRDMLKTLRKLKIKAEMKSTSSFQLQLPQGNVMLYTGKNGPFIYVPQTKQHIDMSYGDEGILEAIKQVA